LSPPTLKTLLLAMLAGLALALSACSGSGASGPPLTAAEFVIRGDEICQSGAEQRAERAAEWFGDDRKPSLAERRSFVAEVVGPNYRSQLEKLRELTPPQGDEARIEQILTGLEHLAQDAESHPDDMLKASRKTKAAKLAAGYGFAVCGGLSAQGPRDGPSGS
jgi:hypothetical protein